MSINEESVFAAAIKLDSDEERGDYLDEVCAANPAMRDRVEALLRSHEEASGLLNPRIADTADLQPAIEKVGATIGPYKLLQQIGEGGFGVVYMAEQQKPLRRKVALKIIKPGMDTKEVIARFEAERQALALMDHPNIAKVFDAGATTTGRPYFVMELVKGIPLIAFCDENNMTTGERLKLFVSVCHAIQHAHQKGIIHRDLKPSNVMVTIHDNEPVPKVIDFGVSKAISQQLTERTLFTAYGQMVGTPVYMSPEQAQMSGLDIDTRSDIYSLGIMLFELLTGSTPLDADRLRKSGYAEMQRMIREEEAPKPSDRLSTQAGEALAKIAKCRGTDPGQLNRQIRGDLDWIVIKALEKDRNRRYETANGFLSDVQRYLHNESVLACPPSTAYRIRKFVSRNRRAVLIAGTVASALLLAVVGLTIGYLRAEKSATDARLAWQNVSREQERTQQEKEHAEQATEKAVAAEQERTEALTDIYTTLGMAAAEGKEKAEAMLWFANAAKIAPDPEREAFNRIRARSFSNDMLVPIAAFQHDATSVGSAEFHASNQFIMTRQLGENHSSESFELGPIAIYEIHSSEILPLPEEWLPLKAAAWSPDGERIAVVTTSGQCLEADFPSMTVLSLIAEDQTAELLRYSPSGKYLAIHGTSSLRLWNTEARGFATPDLPHPDIVGGVEFNGDESLMVTTCWDGKARIFDVLLASDAKATVAHRHSRSSGDSLCQRAIFVGNDRLCVLEHTLTSRYLIIYDAHGKKLKRFPARKGYMRNQSDQYVVTGTRFETVFTDVTSYEQSKLRVAEIHRIALSSKNNLLAICSATGVELRSLDDFELIDRCNAVNRSPNFCDFSPDGDLMCTSERGGLVKVWKRIERNPGTYSVPVSNSFAEVSPDGKYFAAVGVSQYSSRLSFLTVFEVETGEQVFRRRVNFAPGRLNTSQGGDSSSRGFMQRGFSPRVLPTLTDGKFLPFGSAIAVAISNNLGDRAQYPGQQSGRIEVWDWKASQRRFAVQLDNEPRSLDVSPDGKHIAALSANGTVTVVESEIGQIVDRWLAHPPALNNNWYSNNGEIAFSPDGTAIVTWGTKKFARVWSFDEQQESTSEDEPQSRDPSFELKHIGRVLDVKFSPDGSKIATSEWDGQRVQIWDFATGERTGQPMRHPDSVNGIRFSPDGDQIVSSCRDKSVRLWDWRNGTLACPPMPHNDQTHDAAFSNDGKRILTTCYDGSFGIWESKTGKRLAPPIKTGCRGIRLALTPNGSYAILGGHTIGTTRTAISVIKLDQLTLRDERPTDDIVAMAEFFAGHRIQSATPQRLTNQEMVALYEQAKEPVRWVLGLEEYESWTERKQKEQLARMLQIFDGDQDGFLSKTEATPSIERRFDSLDKNSDSNLDPDELAQALQTQATVFLNSRPMGRNLLDRIDWANTKVSELHPSFRQLNKHFDEDGDNRLSREEVDSMLTKAPFLRLEWMFATRRQGFGTSRAPSFALAGLSPSDQAFIQARALLAEGSKLQNENKLDASKEIYRKAADTFQSIPEPRPAEVWRFLGIAQFGSDEYADSLSSFQKHFELSNEKKPSQSRNMITWWHLAIATAETGDKEKAREYYDELIKLRTPFGGAASSTYDRLRKRLEELLEVKDSEAD